MAYSRGGIGSGSPSAPGGGGGGGGVGAALHWSRLYDSARSGMAFQTLVRSVEGYSGPTVLVIRACVGGRGGAVRVLLVVVCCVACARANTAMTLPSSARRPRNPLWVEFAPQKD
jgi:uncharacterized membrane protein